jgi:hypothetical protein
MAETAVADAMATTRVVISTLQTEALAVAVAASVALTITADSCVGGGDVAAGYQN